MRIDFGNIRSRAASHLIPTGLISILLLSLTVPSTIEDFFMPGSQDGESGNLESPNKCDNCHGGYDISIEPAFNWAGSMMAQAARDPVWEACLAITNQDVPEAGDLCVRCHSPQGWLGGRSVPTDGSALTTADREGVHCDVCHRMVKPAPLGVNPYPTDQFYADNTYTADQAYLQSITAIPPVSGNGMFIIDDDNAKRGPFSDAGAKHQFFYSPFHQESAICGTCHDVSNPVYLRNPDDTYSANDFGQASPTFNTYDLFPVERTYSEWLMSDYNSAQGIYAPQFGGNKDYVSTCQDCHMRDVSGVAANKTTAVYRDDLPLHDLTGGNTFIPVLVQQTHPGEVNQSALDSGIVRAERMLTRAASLDLNVTESEDSFTATVRVTNETGHKLPSGYPEGRRIWVNLIAKDINGDTLYESGHYDQNTGILDHDSDVKIYEIKPGLDATIATLTGYEEGPSFHFALNNKIFSDNRIPPRGFTNSAFESIQSPPVGYTYADGQYWDETEYSLPLSTINIVVRLYYQILTKEYVEFLRDENTSNNAGDTLYNLWAANGMSPPVLMNQASADVEADSDGDGIPDISDNCPEIANPSQTDADGDGFGALCDCDDSDNSVTTGSAWYADSDGDGYGNPLVSTTACTAPANYVDNDLDCDDTYGGSYPGAPALPDGWDNDCDGVNDKVSQTINFQTVEDITESQAILMLNAVSSSGLQVRFEVIQGNVHLEGSTLSILGPGSVEITAYQEGNNAYDPADPVSRAFCVNPLKPSIQKSTENNRIVLSSDADTGNHWYLDGNLLSGETGSSIMVVESGSYNVRKTVGNCQSELSEPYYLDLTANPVITESAFVVYPNPAGDILTIAIPKELRNNRFLISVVDLQGRFLLKSLHTEILNGNIDLDISMLHNGSYYFILDNGTTGIRYRNPFIINR
jgi:hypothetical protein